MSKKKKDTGVKKTQAKKISKVTAKDTPKTKEKEGVSLPKTIKIDKEKFKNFIKPFSLVLALFLILVGIDLFVQYLNNDYSIAVVNGQRVSKKEYVQKLEEMYGNDVANMLVEENVIKQLREQENVEISEKDIDEAYDGIAEQVGGKEELEKTLEMYGMTKEELRSQLVNELTMEKIIRPTLEWTDEDLGEFFEQNKEFIYPDTTDVVFEDERENIEDYFVQQKVNEKRGVILQEFKDSINIQLNTPSAKEDENRDGYKFLGATRNVFKNLGSE